MIRLNYIWKSWGVFLVCKRIDFEKHRTELCVSFIPSTEHYNVVLHGGEFTWRCPGWRRALLPAFFFFKFEHLKVLSGVVLRLINRLFPRITSFGRTLAPIHSPTFQTLRSRTQERATFLHSTFPPPHSKKLGTTCNKISNSHPAFISYASRRDDILHSHATRETRRREILPSPTWI